MDETRIGDDERERTTQALSRHLADGRLTLDEFEERLDLVYRARTPSELTPVLADLPALPAPSPVRPSRAQGGQPVLDRVRQVVPTPLLGWIVLSVALVTVWALAGFGFPWPIFPILATAHKAFGSEASRPGPVPGRGWGCGSARAHREAAPGT